MKKRITIQYFMIAISAVFLTLVLTIAVFCRVFTTEMIDDLKNYADILSSTGVFLQGDYENVPQIPGIHVALMDADGNIEYSSDKAFEDWEDEAEIKNALKDGTGYSVCHFGNKGNLVFCYTERLDTGMFLGVSKESGSLSGIFLKAFPAVLLILIIMAAGCFMLARILTHSLIKPIEDMAGELDDAAPPHVYSELAPFVTMIYKQHEDILKNAKMRQEFTANVSHELKTPLTAISGYAELIENGMAADADVIRFASEIHKSSKRLLTLINDIIRLSELDVMDQHVDKEEVDLYDVAYNCVSMLQLSAERHHVSIEIYGNHETVYADKGMMEELVYNLCDNAIRYNVKNGSVRVTVSSVDKEGSKRVVLSVKDTGIGISGEHQERIFERFYRVDKSRSKSTGGTGLGLAIVKHIVAQHGASMDLTSDKGNGTEIRVLF